MLRSDIGPSCCERASPNSPLQRTGARDARTPPLSAGVRVPLLGSMRGIIDTPKGRMIVRVGVFILAYAWLSQAVFPDWLRHKSLVQRGARTVGIVTAKEPQNHQNVRYSFNIGSVQHVGAGPTGKDGVPDFAVIRVGDPIPVTYLSDEPTISLPGDPHELFYDSSLFLFVLIPAGCFLVAWLAPRAFRQSRGQRSETRVGRLWRTLTRR